mmetsp:Transcript_109778/g.275048  ORF Transcript_109778/g.275048 Transcript_109778/m.275048 type:complete len:207 (-) Transcript_109778:826-1446(-)
MQCLKRLAARPPLAVPVALHGRSAAARHGAAILIFAGTRRGLRAFACLLSWPSRGNGAIPTDNAGDGEVGEANQLGTSGCVILRAGPSSVRSDAVHPKHVVGAPIAHHRCHASLESPGKLGHAAVVVDCSLEGARASFLGENDFHALQSSSGINRKGCCNLEGLRGVDAPAARRELLRSEVAGPIPTLSPAEAGTLPAVIMAGVQG